MPIHDGISGSILGFSYLGRYKRKGNTRKVIGVHGTARLGVIDDASGKTETAGWTKNIDTSSYSYGAVISLVNGTGATRTISNVVVKGTPVEMLQGTEGIIHDGFIDHDSVYENGERKIEWGNDFVVTADQTKQIANYLWKEYRGGKHFYMLALSGTRYNLEPGDWYWLKVGGTGQIEYIDAVVQVYQVETYRRAGDLGTTQVMLKEVEEAWKDDSTAYARYIASGRTYQLPPAMEFWVGSQYATQQCNVFCDGTSDEDEINAAITYLSENYGGGVVHLTRGTFNLSGVVEMKSGVYLRGEGFGTILDSDGTAGAIRANGGDGTEIDNIIISDIKIEVTSAKIGIDIDYADDIIIENVCIDDCLYGITVNDSDTSMINNVSVYNFATGGIYIYNDCTNAKVSNITIDNNDVAGSCVIALYIAAPFSTLANITLKDINSNRNGETIGIYINGVNVVLSNASISNMTHDGTGGFTVYGLYIGGAANTTCSNIRIDDIDDTGTAANSRGLYLSSDKIDIDINIQGCSGTGVEIAGGTDRTKISGITYNNGTNFTDSGTNTNSAGLISA